MKKTKRYETIAEEEEFLSSTEVESQTEMPEKPKTSMRSTRSSRSQRPKKSKTSILVSRFRRFRWVIDFVLLLVNISLSILLLRNFNQEKSSGVMQVGGDFMGAGPQCECLYLKFLWIELT